MTITITIQIKVGEELTEKQLRAVVEDSVADGLMEEGYGLCSFCDCYCDDVSDHHSGEGLEHDSACLNCFSKHNVE